MASKQEKQTQSVDKKRKVTETISSAERKRLLNILDIIPGYVCFITADYRIPLANDKFIKLFGEPANRSCYQIFRDRPSPCENCPTLKAFESGHETWEWDHKNGRSYMIYDNLFMDLDGTQFILEIGLDITDRKMAEDEIRAKEQQFRTIADFTYDWEYWLQPDGSLSYNSPSCSRITGRSAQDYIKNPGLLVKIVHPEDREHIRQHLEEARSSERVYALDYRIIDKSGNERWIGHACQAVYTDNGVHIGRRASNRDITESKKAEKALLQAERLAAMGRLIASLAHEINNPLQAISNSLELAIDFPLEEEERQQYLKGARQEVERLIHITRGILDYTRPQEIKQTTSNVNEVIKRTLEITNDKLKKNNITTSVDIPAQLPVLPISSDQLGQVFLNLVLNAIDQMQDGGSLTITAEQNGEAVVISFRDNGTGIPQNKLDYIFEPFFTTKTDGTGLGLSISQNIIRTYRGKITAENIKNNGAVFKVFLPLNISSYTSSGS